MDGPHGLAIPLAVRDTVGKSQIPVTDSLVLSSVKIESSDKDLPEDEVEGRLGIQEEDKKRFGGVKRVLY